jgi:predicted dehydrogenase
LTEEENILIIGLGLIGKQRLDACLEFGVQPECIYGFDIGLSKLSFVNNQRYVGVHFIDTMEKALSIKIDRAIVAVPHGIAAPIVSKLLSRNIKVLLEKPLGRNIREAQELASHLNAAQISIGFNYRFMPGIVRLKKILEKNALGKISTLRMELGHGGGPKDKESWKLNPEKAGGGVLLDPGIHLIDLLIFLFNANDENLKIVGKTVWRGFWNTGIEESSNLIGYLEETPFCLASSVVAWRTRFKIEVIGTERYFEIDGRGRSDGPQTITEGPKWGWLSSPSQISSESQTVVATNDRSLIEETFAWLNENKSVCSIDEAVMGMKIYEQILRSGGES